MPDQAEYSADFSSRSPPAPSNSCCGAGLCLLLNRSSRSQASSQRHPCRGGMAPVQQFLTADWEDEMPPKRSIPLSRRSPWVRAVLPSPRSQPGLSFQPRKTRGCVAPGLHPIYENSPSQGSAFAEGDSGFLFAMRSRVADCGCGAGIARGWWRKIAFRRRRRRRSDHDPVWWDAQSEGWASAQSAQEVADRSLPSEQLDDALGVPISDDGHYGIPALTPEVASNPLVKDQIVIHETTHWGKHHELALSWPPCICAFPSAHSEDYSFEIPINSPPAPIVKGSYFEALIHARSICGHWITDLSRSDSLDPQMEHIGLGRLKRTVMNRLAIPFTAVMENDNTLLHSWIHTPLGPKRMRASLLGEEITDVDNEVGTWAGVARMVDFSRPWFCGGRPVRALQLHRWSSRHGTAYETRVILPDEKEGKILLFNITLYPRDEDRKPPIIVDRILRFDHY